VVIIDTFGHRAVSGSPGPLNRRTKTGTASDYNAQMWAAFPAKSSPPVAAVVRAAQAVQDAAFPAPVLAAEPKDSRYLDASGRVEKNAAQDIDDPHRHPHRQERRSAPTGATTYRPCGGAHCVDCPAGGAAGRSVFEEPHLHIRKLRLFNGNAHHD
jgi:hypothetical protein